MSKTIENLEAAQQRAIAGRRPGVKHNHWFLPACQSLYLTQEGPIVSQRTPLLSGTADVPKFNRDALVAALRADQAGKSTFPELGV